MSGMEGATASEILARVASGDRTGAIDLIGGAAGLDDAARAELRDAASVATPAGFAATMGRLLRGTPASRDAVNECNRAEFYLSGRSRELAENPLYALFLAGRDGTLLDKWVHYFDIYHRHLAKYRGRSPRVLEIGVYKGGGLALWRHYFGPGALLVGVDIDPDAAAAGGGSPVVIGDQSDPAFLESVERRYGPFDVVVDDGGHTMRQQVTGIETLFPRLAVGGTYIVEDTHTSYWPEYRDQDQTFLDWVRDRIDSLHANHDPQGDPDSVWSTAVGSIEVSDSMVVLTRDDRFRPFSEVAGSTDFLSEARTSTARIADLEQERNVLSQRLADVEERLGVSARREPPGESDELRLLRSALSESRREVAALAGELRAAEAELSTTRGKLLDAWEHIRGMRNTVSWRLTTPLRVGRLVRRR